MPGDPFRDAWRTRYQYHRQARGIAWPIKDLDVTKLAPDASQGFSDIEFSGGVPETLGSWGSPGSNDWDEFGQVSIGVFCPLGNADLRDQADAIVALYRTAFRNDRFWDRDGNGHLRIRVTGTAPLTTGVAVGGLRVVSALLAYRIVNRG